MFVGTHASKTPQKPALIIAETGERITYKELNDNSMRIAQFLYAQGLRPGDAIAILLENHVNYMDFFWAALRSGLYAVPLNRYSTPEEAAYIVNDSGAQAIFSSEYMSGKAGALVPLVPDCKHLVMVGEASDGWMAYETLLSKYPAEPLENERMGDQMPYTSGTTGRPKGVVRPMPDNKADDLWFRVPFMRESFDLDDDMTYYAPAPMYHGAPLQFMRAVHCLGGTIVQVQKFDEIRALEHIQHYKVTHTQMVPTMFVRMLKLDASLREKFDISSLRSAIHAAAPCPKDVKHAMIDWWGPIIHEYYGATDGGRMVPIKCDDWIEHPGAVGKPEEGFVKICDDDGSLLPSGEAGLIYFVHPGEPHSYRNDPEKTKSSRHPGHHNWTTSGDIGLIDDDGYLFLTDRKAFMIISGGVNIYPQIVEDALICHNKIADAAVFGVPNKEMGEEVKAVVELLPNQKPSDALASEIMEYISTRVSKYMMPRSLDFIEKLPRTPAGKLLKKQMRDTYWN